MAFPARRPTAAPASPKAVRIGTAACHLLPGVDGFHIVEGLEYCSEHLLGFGGHEMACGLSIDPSQVMNFRKKINQSAESSGFTFSSESAPLSIDTDIQLAELTENFLNNLHLLSPHGPGNPKPLFLVRKVITEGPPRIIKNTHLKLRIRDGNQRVEAMWFGNAEKAELFQKNSQTWDLACHARMNEYNGYQSVELQLKDVRPTK